MSTEIEFKFLVGPNVLAVLTPWVDEFVAKNHNTQVKKSKTQLSNTYYDSDQQLLRQAGMALRLRRDHDNWVQTIKTKGTGVGGVHQRNEYNVALNEQCLDVSLFDEHILPHNYSISQLRALLKPIFTTDFTRITWRIHHPSCVFEMVYDLGEVRCRDEALAISEVEIELVSGDISVMYAFARKLVKFMAEPNALYDGMIRLGVFSKAARGYQLFAHQDLPVKSHMTQVPLDAKDSIEQAFIKTMEYGLDFMQYHEQCYFDTHDVAALRRFNDGVALLRHALSQYHMLISHSVAQAFDEQLVWLEQTFAWVEQYIELEAIMSKTGKYRKRLELNTALAKIVAEEEHKMPQKAQIEQFFCQSRYNQFILDLGRWLMDKGWRDHDRQEDVSVHSQGSLQLLSCDMLNASWHSLLKVLPKQHDFNIEDYIQHHQQLKSSLMTGTCVGGLYSTHLRSHFRDPWLDLSCGIEELKTLYLLQSFTSRLEPQSNSQTTNWLQQQIEGLLNAMEHSRLQAIKMKPYWGVS